MSPESLQHLPHYVYWWTLVVAVVFELIGTTFIREAKGFAHPSAALKACGCYLICTALCIIAFAAHIDLSVGYTVWCVVGIVATALIGKFRFGETFNATKVAALVLCAAGSILLVMNSERPSSSSSSMHASHTMHQELHAWLPASKPLRDGSDNSTVTTSPHHVQPLWTESNGQTHSTADAVAV